MAAVTLRGDLNRPLTNAEMDANFINLNEELATKESAITAAPTAATAKYWRGDKTWSDFFTDVRAATLTGLSTATNAVVAASDTVLAAIGKLQTQVNSKVSKSGDTMVGALNFAPLVSVASATTVNIGLAKSNHVTITGTTTITGLGTSASGVQRVVVFAGALVITHNATSLILPGGTNITTAAGDVAEFVSLGAGNWRCTGYMRASGQAVSVSPLPNTLVKAVENPGAASFTAWPGNHYLIWSVITATLPASPTVGDTIYFTSYTAGWTVARNGNVISGVAEDLAVDVGGPGRAMRTFGLRFIEAGSNVGWAII